MSFVSRPWSALLTVALAAWLPAPAAGQTSADNTKKPQNGAYATQLPPGYHTASVGRGGTDSSDYAAGYDRRASGAYLSTAPALGPAVSAPAMASASAYTPNTFTPYYPPWGTIQAPKAATIQGLASLTSATGQYYKDVQQASIAREQKRQMSLETTRQMLQLQADYEANRPTAPKMAEIERKNSVDWARNYASRTEIAAGNTLNVLLKSCLAARNPLGGPNVMLDAETLKGINLTDKSSRGNLTMAKDEGKIAWTESLEEPVFDTARDSFSKNFAKATEYVNVGKSPDRMLIRDLKADLKTIEGKLEDEVATLPPSRYIESRRLIKQLKDTVQGLSDPRLVKASGSDWRKSVRNVSDLVGHCMKHGVEFGPAAAPGDWAAYSATYYALRSYEREIAP
jgi:hypothetical protein